MESDYTGLMTTSQIAFTAHADDDAPAMDMNGDPRFVTERDMADADAANLADADVLAEEYAREEAAWQAEVAARGGYWFP